MIRIEGLCKRFATRAGQVVALQDIDLQVCRSERLGLFGPSGSGKTTLLRCIAGLEAPDAGSIRIGDVEVYDAQSGINLPPWKRPIGVVFQDFALWPHMNVLDNVMFPLRHGRATTLAGAAQRRAALDALQMVRMTEFAERFPGQLSGGQRQRVAVARALVSMPSLLLMDEPLSNLDPHLRKRTRDELIELLERVGITTVLVSHDHVDGFFMSHSVGIMREGRLVQRGRPAEVVANPVNAAVAETLDVGSVFQCRALAAEVSGTRCQLLGSEQFLVLPAVAATAVNDGLHVLLPRDSCHLWRGDDTTSPVQRLRGTVVREGYTGRGWCILVSIAGVNLDIWESEPPGLLHGDFVDVAVDMSRVRLLP